VVIVERRKRAASVSGAKAVKEVISKSETRFGFPSPKELTEQRLEAREAMRKTVVFRWAKFAAAQQAVRRSAEADVRAGGAKNAAHAFWYQNEQHITTLLYLVYYTLSDQSRSQADLQNDLAFSAPFVRKLYRTALERDLITRDLRLTDASLEIYFWRVEGLLALTELGDFADSLHVWNVARSKPANIEKQTGKS
jgi:hypothetical protein